MLKRLRWKFTLLLTLLLSGVLAAVLVVQTGSNLQQYRAGTDAVLAAALRRSQAALDPCSAPWSGDLDQDLELYTAIPAFCAVVDGEGQILLALSYNAAVERADVARAVVAALTDGQTAGRLPALGLRYQVQASRSYASIAFADLAWERAGGRRQVLSAALLFAAGFSG